jgi:RimJ/RimL family protein N-acetyltransferase
MSSTVSSSKDPAAREAALARLARDPGAHAWAIQDLQLWPEDTTLFFREPASPDAGLDYLLLTGHPGARRTRTVVLGGTLDGVRPLLAHLPPAPWLVRETPADLLPALAPLAPGATPRYEWRMEVARDGFRPAHTPGRARRLVDADAAALAAFNDAPAAAAPGLLHWIRGAMLFGVFEEGRLVAIASTFVRVPSVWELIGIRTRPEARGKGLATEVTSALTAAGLDAAPRVTLTVLQSNAPALRVYGKLGYQRREARIWLDNGTGSPPEF